MSGGPGLVGRDAARRFLGALVGSAPPGSWIELRFRVGAGMSRSFYRAGAVEMVAARALALASRTDVFVGVVPRARRGGGRGDLVERASVVWVDCDGPGSVRALEAFRPAPAIVVASGSGRNRHAYWFLREPVELDALEALNVGVAVALGGDRRSCDPPRILRVAGSMNHKESPARPVRLLVCDERARVGAEELVHFGPRERPKRAALIGGGERGPGGDPLLALRARVYVERLLGVRVGRSGKVRCPFHEDRTASLHVYEEPGRGWYCFGCGRGGSVYDLAAELWGRGTRGREFVRLQRDLGDIGDLGR